MPTPRIWYSSSCSPGRRWTRAEARGGAAPVLACVGAGAVLLPSLLDELQHRQAALLVPAAWLAIFL